MLTVDFLQHYGLDALCARFAIRAKRHGAYPNLVQLKYSQVFSPMREPIVRECRGLVVDEADGWRVVCRAYDKFFNLGEPNAPADFDWATARVFEKLDGSLITLYPYREAWHVASSGVPDAAGAAHEAGVSFAELFRRTWATLGYRWPDLPAAGDRGRCYMFELTTPQNRVIVRHDRPRVALHGARDLNTLAEVDPEPIAAAHGWEGVRSFSLACAADCLAAAERLEPAAAEGYVVRDAAFRRLKVKSPRYVALTHLKERVTGRRLLEIVRANESDEFLAYFPQFRPAYEAVQAAFDALCAEADADYARLSGLADQKAFAAEAMRTRCPSPLFARRAGRCDTARAFFATATMPLLERAIRVDLDRLVAPSAEPPEAE